MNTNNYLDLVQKSLDIKSDYALAMALGVTRGTISNFRKNRNSMGVDTAVKIAAILHLHPAVVVAHGCAERAQNDEEKRLWDEVAAKFSPVGFVPNAQSEDAASA